ncbi:putative cullin [Helianthus debilis subsp. tardiflorus]
MRLHLIEIVASLEASQGPLFLEELNNKWMEHKKALQTIQDIFMYMDRTYIPSHEISLNLWTNNIICYIETRLQVALLEIVQKERNGVVINRGLMRDIIKMLVDLGPFVYLYVFEQPFLDVSASFYRGESQQLIECCDCLEIKWWRTCISLERCRFDSHLVQSEALVGSNRRPRETRVGSLSQTGFTGYFTVMPMGGWVTRFSPKLVVDSGYSRSTPFVQWVPRECSGLSLLAVQKKNKKTEKCLDEEIDRVAQYLDAESEVKIIDLVEKEMIESQMNWIVSGLVNMITEDKYNDLAWIYIFFCRRPNGLKMIQDVMTSHIRVTGKQLVINPEQVKDPLEFVQRLSEEKHKHDKIISLAFNNDKTFQNALNSSFEYIINLNRRTQESIFLFVDDKLRKGFQGMSEDDVEVLHRVLMLLSYLQDKDVFENYYKENSVLVDMIVNDKYDDLARTYNSFHRVPNGLTPIRNEMTSHIQETCKQLFINLERVKDPVAFVQRLLEEKHKHDKITSLAFNNDKTFQNALNSSFEYFINSNLWLPEFICLKKYYKQHLAKQLLSGISVYEDAERSLILKLKTECGYQFTSKLEGMFTDMKTSQDIMQGFYDSMGPMLADGPTLKVHVLTTGSWPTQSTTTCNLPPEILTMCDKFKTYFLGTHNGCRLTWQTNMGSADIESTFSGGEKHELNVSTHQMCVLMLFNNADRLNYK